MCQRSHNVRSRLSSCAADARTTSVIFASPHSGRDYPAAFLRGGLDAQEIRSSEDAFVDLLYADAPRFGAPLLTANAPRAYLDLNRGPRNWMPR